MSAYEGAKGSRPGGGLEAMGQVAKCNIHWPLQKRPIKTKTDKEVDAQYLASREKCRIKMGGEDKLSHYNPSGIPSEAALQGDGGELK